MNPAMLRAFLDDIKSHPDDDTPRLILADWLEEQASTEAVHDRGTLFRLQCAAAHLSEFDPDAVAMRNQARNLIARHEHLWLGELAGLTIFDVQFVRGMLHLTLSGAPLRSDSFLGASRMSWSWAESLTILANGGDMRGAESSPLLEHFTRLEIIQQGLFSDWSRLINSDYLTQLADLTLVHSSSGDGEIVSLRNSKVLPRLRHLTIRFGGVNPSAWGTLADCREISGLSSLGVAWCDTCAEGFDRLARSQYLTGLRELNLDSNRIPGAALSALSAATFSNRLERLSLAGNSLGDVRALSDVSLPALRHLDLAGCHLDDTALEHLAEAGWLASLQTLDLRSATLTESGPTFLAAPLDATEVLRLGSCGLTPEGLSALASSGHLTSLRELHLRDNFVGDAGVAELLRGNYPALRVLNLDASRLTDESLRFLADWPGLAELWSLSLVGNTFSEGGLRWLADSVYRSPRTRFVLE